MIRSGAVLVVGLTGGIGCGKSTVASMLAERGAVIVDADRLTRELQSPGHQVYDEIVERFGSGVVCRDGTLDRAALAGIVFADHSALADLEEIVHPRVQALIAERVGEHAGTDHVVILDVPIMSDTVRMGTAATIVVDCPPEVAITRLVVQRGMSEEDARKRMGAQISREERLANAEFVVDNGGTREGLEREVARTWRWIEDLRARVT